MNRFDKILGGDGIWAPTADERLLLALKRRGVNSGGVFPTSGSSGDPKFVQLSLQALKVSAASVNRWLDIGKGDVLALALPDYHVGGFMVGFRAALAGASFVEFDGAWDPERFASFLREKEVTMTSLVPAQLADLVERKITAPSAVKVVVIGGAALESRLATAGRKLRWPILASYGMSETASQVATQPLDEVYVEGLPLCLPHSKFEVIADGRLRLSGSSLFDGYWELENERWEFNERLGEQWLTSDRVSVESGRVRHLGRIDQVVKILGEQVNLDEIRQDLAELTSSGFNSEFEIIDVADSRTGARLVLIGDASTEELQMVLSMLNQGKPGLFKINEFLQVEKIPRSALGKPMRGEMRKLYTLREN